MSGRFSAARSTSLRTPKAISSVDALTDSEQRGDARILDGAVAQELLHDLDGRPVRDALAVREAPPGDDPRVGAVEEVPGQAGLSDARRSEDGEERAGALRAHPVPGVGEHA